jgi:hypothetical protein
MTTICRSISLALLGVVASTGLALGADRPLLVVVEAAPGCDIGAAEIRQVIAAELAEPVVGAREGNADAATDILVVGLEPHEIRMSLRAGAAPIVSRTIAAPPDRPGRLRSIGWLAGNLVRDQISPIVSAGESSPPNEARAPTEPPALRPNDAAASPTNPAAVLSAVPATPPGASPHSVWAITASGGPAAALFTLRSGGLSDAEGVRTTFRVALQWQPSPASLLYGVALDVGPQSPTHYAGVAAFVGVGRYRRAWLIEGNLGLGAEVLEGRPVTVTNSSAPGTSDTRTYLAAIAGLYLRPEGIAGIRLSPVFDLLGKVGLHLSTTGEMGTFLSTTIGVRLRLP